LEEAQVVASIQNRKIKHFMKTVVLFGGTGFIGTHLTQHLLRSGLAETVYLVDLNSPREFGYAAELNAGLASGRVVFVKHDIRKPVPIEILPATVDLIVNLAAIHREPGHAAQEYFETNLLGAQNVCSWAENVDCRTIVFTSSISPYGPSEEMKTEASLPVPETAYGSSKLAAEKLHLIWQAGKGSRKLLILRPGVVFGPGEGGNVSRLVRSLASGYFVYLGNRKTIKAAGYVKELCLVTTFALNVLAQSESNALLLNFTMDPPPSMEDIVQAILRAGGRGRRPIELPYKAILAVSHIFGKVGKVFGIQSPVDPVRIRKLVRSNNIIPEQLKRLGYNYTYSLDTAFLDWKKDAPEDF
jgi:nucleoside-diphosphate-sugar epimerase